MGLARNVTANATASLVTMVAGVVFLPFYLIRLGAEPYALIGFHAAISAIIAAMDGSFGQIVNQYYARSRSFEQNAPRSAFRRWEAIAAAGSLVTFLMLAAAAEFIATRYFNQQTLSSREIQTAITLSAAIIGLRWSQAFYINVLAGLEKQISVNAVTAASTLVQFGGGLIALEWMGRSVLVFFQFALLVQLAATVILSILARRVCSASSDSALPASRTGLSIERIFVAQVVGANLLGALISQSDKFIVGGLADMETLGIYSFCTTVASMILRLASPVFSAFYPRLALLAHASGQRKELVTAYHTGCQLISVLVWPAAAMLVFFSSEIIFAWTGSTTLAASTYPILPLLALGNAFNSMAQIPYAMQLAHSWARLAFWQNVFAAAVFIPGGWYLMTRFGVNGLAAAWVAVNTMYCFIGVALMHKKLLPNEYPRWLALDVTLPVVAVIPMMYLVHFLIPPDLSRLEIAIVMILLSASGVVLSTLGASRIRTEFQKRIRRER